MLSSPVLLSSPRSYNINKLAEQAVEEILKLGKCAASDLAAQFGPSVVTRLTGVSAGKSQTGLNLPLNQSFIEKGEFPLLLRRWRGAGYTVSARVCAVTDRYNEALVFCSADGRLLYSVREPIVNRVFFSSRQRGFASKSVPACEPDGRVFGAV